MSLGITCRVIVMLAIVGHITVNLCQARSAYGSPGATSTQDGYWNQVQGGADDVRDSFRELCPDLDDPVTCYERYLASGEGIQPRIGFPVSKNEDVLAGKAEKRVHTRLSRRLCPPGIDQVGCFDRYVTLWLQAIAGSEGKRTFGPGKRSSLEALPQEQYSMPDSDASRDDFFMTLCLSAEEPPACFTQYVTAYHTPQPEGGATADVTKLVTFANMLCTRASDKTACYSDVTGKYVGYLENVMNDAPHDKATEELAEMLGGEMEASRQPTNSRDVPSRLVQQLQRMKQANQAQRQINGAEEKRAICPSGVSKLDCFDSFLGKYAQSGGSRGANHFIGKRSAARKHGPAV